MARRVVSRGAHFTIAFAGENSGGCPHSSQPRDFCHGLISHGFIKKKDKTPRREIERAWRILGEDQAQPRLALVKKGKE
jgi:hypothetical protein